MAIRIGAEDKKKRVMAGILGALALSLGIHTAISLMGGSPPPAAPPPAVATHSASTANRASGQIQAHAAQKLESASALDPTLHPEKMLFAETTEYTGNGRNIFSKNSVPPPPPAMMVIPHIEKPIAPVRTGPAPPPPPPPPPPINLKFYGFATEQNGRKMVFLMEGEDIFVGGEGDIVDRRYRIVQIQPAGVVMEDLAYDDNQTLPLQDNK